jgi:hypothetical protein
MAEQRLQSFENHARVDPVFHYFLLPFSAGLFLAAAVHAFLHPAFLPIWSALLSLAFVFAVFRIRIYSLKVQNRVIRLEERLRLTSLLAEPERSRIGELTEAQLIALRFASDGEAPALAARALAERLAPADIKKSIRSWRADYYRV